MVIYVLFLAATIYGLVRFVMKKQPLISSIMVSNLMAICSKYSLLFSIFKYDIVRVTGLIYLLFKDPEQNSKKFYLYFYLLPFHAFNFVAYLLLLHW